MKNAKPKQPAPKKKKRTDRAPYEQPAIIYEGLITTTAGPSGGNSPDPDDSIDPADIFSSDS